MRQQHVCHLAAIDQAKHVHQWLGTGQSTDVDMKPILSLPSADAVGRCFAFGHRAMPFLLVSGSHPVAPT
jgi:hypothetical protein